MRLFFQFLLDVGYFLISKFPEIDFVLPPDLVGGASSILSCVAYFIPFATLVPLFSLKFLVVSFRIVVAVFKFVKSFIPFISGG